MAAAPAPRIREKKAGPFQTGGDFLVARQTLAAQRRAGASFDEAWTLAMKMVSVEDRAILRETRHAWACAYARETFHSGGSFGKLAAVTVHDDDTQSRGTQRLIA
jgi:hypothetical protein